MNAGVLATSVAWHRLGLEGDCSGDALSIGGTECLPVVNDDVVVSWLVPSITEGADISQAAKIGGAPVWLVTGRETEQWSLFEASYWGLGVIRLSETGACIACWPSLCRAASRDTLETLEAVGLRVD